MKKLLGILLIGFTVMSSALGQTAPKTKKMKMKKITYGITPSEWNQTFRTPGTSEVGRTIVTLSNDLTKIHVSYIDGNYQNYSCDKTLTKLTDQVYVTADLTCGGASGYNAEITLNENMSRYKLDLIFRYCEGGQLRNVSKHLENKKSMTPATKHF
ncbi:MAG: hypothetical protein U0Y10_08985 [Spirosomataceae bacterium]